MKNHVFRLRFLVILPLLHHLTALAQMQNADFVQPYPGFAWLMDIPLLARPQSVQQYPGFCAPHFFYVPLLGLLLGPLQIRDILFL